MMRPLAMSAAALCLIAAIVVTCPSLHPSRTARAAEADAPAYTSGGDMLPPTHYREWTYLTTGIDMSYSAKGNAEDHSMFDNVFVNPAAYHSFLATGTWPDKTVLVLEVREARSKGSINQHGHFQGAEVMDLEVHVKDEARFPGKWAFFSFDAPDKNGTLIPPTAPCYTCHAQHAAVDTTFVQFYPTLLSVAHDKNTLSAAYLKDTSSENQK
jgi:hypothetical protein